MGKYLLDNVHAQFPDAKLGIVVASRGSMIRDLFANTPYIEVFEVNRRSFRSLWRLWKGFRGSDLVVTQYAGKPGGRFSLATKCVARLLARRGGLVGFADAAPRTMRLYDHVVDKVIGTAPAELERRALETAGIPVSIDRPQLSIMSTPEVLQRFGVRKSEFVLVHLFAGNKGRGISPEKKRTLVQALVHARPGVQFVLTGTESERAEVTRVVQDLPVVVAAGKTSVQDMLHLMVDSLGVVSVDTGAAHMAAQLRVPLVVLATCLGLHWWKPEQYGSPDSIRLFTHHEPEGHVFKEYPSCIDDIDLCAVADACTKF